MDKNDKKREFENTLLVFVAQTRLEEVKQSERFKKLDKASKTAVSRAISDLNRAYNSLVFSFDKEDLPELLNFVRHNEVLVRRPVVVGGQKAPSHKKKKK